MEITMDILQNSKDYLNQSIELADIADEFGNHDEDKANKNAKIKWKLAFICIVQSLELLCKNILHEINDKLIYKDIDTDTNGFSITINLSTAICRIMNFSDITFDESEKLLIDKSIRLRNDFIHNNVKLHTEELKVLYCRLLKLYNRLYLRFIDTEFFISSKTSRGYGNFMHFAEYLVPFRGNEVRKDELDEIKISIKENQQYHFYLRDGIKYERIKYGDEIKKFPELFVENVSTGIYDYEHCDDCAAIKGEYHGEECDLEICPRCKGQRLSCNCFDKYRY